VAADAPAATGASGRGGKTSHAAVVARGMGKPYVCGAEQLDGRTGVVASCLAALSP
jgi:phosphoenolpyruvate synthase/pyruvate phosphate dikinase